MREFLETSVDNCRSRRKSVISSMIASINYQGRGIRPLETEQPAALDGSVVKISGSESTPPENFKFDSASGRVPAIDLRPAASLGAIYSPPNYKPRPRTTVQYL